MSRVLGMVLMVLGLFAFVWGSFSYTTSEKVVDIGPIHATRDKTHTLPVAPIAGALAIAGGIVLVVSGRKRMA